MRRGAPRPGPGREPRDRPTRARARIGGFESCFAKAAHCRREMPAARFGAHASADRAGAERGGRSTISEYHFAEDVDRPNPEPTLARAPAARAPRRNNAARSRLWCGVGDRLVADRGRVRRAVGLDFSRTALDLAARHASGRTAPLSIGVRRWNGAALRGCGIRSRVLVRVDEHFPDVRSGFTEVARVLRPGGIAVTVVPNFYVRTGQPVEHRATLAGWRHTSSRAPGSRSPAYDGAIPGRRSGRTGAHCVSRCVSPCATIGTLPPLRYQFRHPHAPALIDRVGRHDRGPPPRARAR